MHRILCKCKFNFISITYLAEIKRKQSARSATATVTRNTFPFKTRKAKGTGGAHIHHRGYMTPSAFKLQANEERAPSCGVCKQQKWKLNTRHDRQHRGFGFSSVSLRHFSFGLVASHYTLYKVHALCCGGWLRLWRVVKWNANCVYGSYEIVKF